MIVADTPGRSARWDGENTLKKKTLVCMELTELSRFCIFFFETAPPSGRRRACGEEAWSER